MAEDSCQQYHPRSRGSRLEKPTMVTVGMIYRYELILCKGPNNSGARAPDCAGWRSRRSRATLYVTSYETTMSIWAMDDENARCSPSSASIRSNSFRPPLHPDTTTSSHLPFERKVGIPNAVSASFLANTSIRVSLSTLAKSRPYGNGLARLSTRYRIRPFTNRPHGKVRARLQPSPPDRRHDCTVDHNPRSEGVENENRKKSGRLYRPLRAR